jgi:hypothetical protein
MIEASGKKVRRPNEIKKGDTAKPRLRAGVETVDEITGDWTLDTARQKLHEFLARRKIALEYIMDEIGQASSRTYIVRVYLEKSLVIVAKENFEINNSSIFIRYLLRGLLAIISHYGVIKDFLQCNRHI